MSFEHVIGLGVAGNFAGHLEQAGEAADFRDLQIKDPRAPKGVFPFYVPTSSIAAAAPAAASSTTAAALTAAAPSADGGHENHFLNVYPVSSSEIRLGSPDEKHQIEPEVSLLCDLEFGALAGGRRRVVRIRPLEAMAHNDCSIRREGAKKISEKKNWGACSKGTASRSIPIDRFEAGGILDGYRIASFLMRGEELHPYGVDSAVSSYSYMYRELLDWLVVKMNDQIDEGPLENISDWLARAAYPRQALISIGATRYTEFGETHFLAPGDESIVALYDADRFDLQAIEKIARNERPLPSAGISLLRQSVL